MNMTTPSKVPRAMPSQKILVKEQVSNVILVNPETSVSNSINFMKQMTTVAVSTIAYLRGVFPADAFVTKKLAGQNVFVLRGIEDEPGTKMLINWIKSAFDLVHSHHLKKMILVIQKQLVTLEMYTFSFCYDHEAIHYDFLGEVEGRDVLLEQSQGLPEDIAKSVRQMARSIITHTTMLNPLPDYCELSVKLLLDENTPEEVLPKFFEPSAADGFNFPAEIETLKLGKVESKFIKLAVSTKTVMNEESYTYGGTNKKKDNAPQEDVEDEVLSSQMEIYHSITSNSSLKSNVSQLVRHNLTDNKAPENDSNTTNLSEKLSVVSLKEKTICCICECSDLFNDPQTIKCVSCSTFQHKTCYKLLECHQVESHICVKCHNPNQGKPCSVPELLNVDNRKESALYRQALMYCCNSSQVSCKRIMTHLMVTRRMAEKIFQKLDTDGCLQPATNKGHVRNVKLDFKENILGRFFRAPTSSDSTLMYIQDSPSIVTSDVNGSVKRKLTEDIQDSPSIVTSDVSGSVKRKLTEEKENAPPQTPSPQPKRCKILMTARNLKKSFHNYV